MLFVRLEGELTKKTVFLLKENVIANIKKAGIRYVVVNLKKLTQIDFKGMNCLLYMYELCRDNQGKILICGLEKVEIYEKLQKNKLFNYLIQINNEINAFDLVNTL